MSTNKAPVNDAIIVAVARLVDDAQSGTREPSHSDLEFQINRAGLSDGHLPKTKNGDPRTIPLNSVALAALNELHGEGKIMRSVPVFPSLRSGESLQGSRGWFPSALEEAKIEGYTWHCNRHTFASRLVMAGVDLRTVAELLGHRTLQMVMRYSHLAPQHQASAVDRLVKARNQRDTKSDTGGSAAKATKRKNVASS